MHTGNTIKAAMAAKGKTKAELSNDLGIWEQNLNSLLKGSSCNTKTLEAVAKSFKMSLGKFIIKYEVSGE